MLTPVLEHVVDNLHDTGAVLENGDFRTLVHLQRAIQETVNGNSCVAVDAAEIRNVSMIWSQ